MGQILSQPVTDKSTEEGKDDRLVFGVSSMQGWRISMEDAHSAVLDLKPISTSFDIPIGSSANALLNMFETDFDIKQSELAKSHTPINERVSFFGVYDGHGGSKASEFAGRFLHMILAKQEAFKKGDYATALKDGFLSTDKALIYYPPYRDDGSGCTATTALFANNKVFVANAGDSRTVLGVKGIAKPLSFDHKPQHDGERSRIVNAGGFVGSDRVNGNLALSRALGDFDFKRDYFRIPEEQIVTALPDVISHEITPDDEFVVLACDGIWDCMNSQTVVEYVRRQIAMGFPLEVICENIMDHCISPSSDMSGIGCDNMTILIVGILNGKTEEEWREMITQRVANNDGPAASVEDVQPKSKIETSHSHGFESESDHIQDFFQGGSQKLTLQSLLSQNATITTSEDGSLVIKTSAAAASNFLKQNADELEVEDDDDDDYEHDGDKETIESKDDKSATESEESKKN